MNDIIREPYELSIWELQDIKAPFVNLMPPLSSAYKDEWEEFSDDELFLGNNNVNVGNFVHVLNAHAKDWSSLSFQNGYWSWTSNKPTYCTHEILESKKNYTFFIDIQEVVASNYGEPVEENSKWPTLSIYRTDGAFDVFIGKIIIQNNTFVYNLGSSTGTKIKLIFDIPSTGINKTALIDFQIRLSLFDESYTGQVPPNPFPLYKIGQAQLQEKKKYVIGSSSMTIPYRAINPIVKENVNGDKTLTFSLYSRYLDEEIGDFVDNPFINFLHNETYLKLHRGQDPTKGWEEYVIKNINENSTNSLYTYTAKRASIIELSKNGYDLEFSSELMNNQGTAIELTAKALEGTDWKIDEENCEKFWGILTEPVYKVRLVDFKNISCIRQVRADGEYGYEQKVSVNYPIPSKKQIVYIPYSSYQNYKTTDEIQILWRENFDEIEGDDQNIIYNANSYLVSGEIKLEDIEIVEGLKCENLQKRIRSLYLSNIGKVAEIWEDENKNLVYKITEVEYKPIIGPSELIVNGKDFVSTTGWRRNTNSSIQLSSNVDRLEDIVKDSYIVYLQLQNLDQSNFSYIYNASIRSNASVINNDFLKGNNYCCNIKGKNLEQIKSIIVAPYDYDESNNLVLDASKILLNFNVQAKKNEDNSEEANLVAACSHSVSKNTLVDENYGLFLKLKPKALASIKEISFFKEVKHEGETLTPTSVLSSEDLAGEKIIKENYFDPLVGNNLNATSMDEITFEPLITTGGEKINYTPCYYGEYEKVSSIQVSKSNRFNILQEICEAFECWMDFNISHDAQGKIIDKKIILKAYVGDNKQVGFSYGLNLKDVGRTLVSDQIVTKLIVEPNNNENALNGFCTVARSSENISRDNTLFNFDYYINQKMLDSTSVFEDFYGEMGIITRLGKINSDMQQLNEELALRELTKNQYQSYLSAAKEATEAIAEEIDYLKQDLYDRTGINFEGIKDFSEYDNDKSKLYLKNIIIDINFQIKNLTQKKAEFSAYDLQLKLVQNNINILKTKIERLLQDQNSYLTIFNEKYGNYIQEGSWNDESYYDDTLYYLDAQNVLYNSAFPKVSYTINVIDLSPLGDEFKPFTFKVGDKTYVEDIEFFGWNAAKTAPYKEEVVISEIEENLDSPDLNKITVQNYKTQFEDLFQRISATTQSLQLVAGAYQRAANKITSSNSIDPETVQNSFINRVINLQNAGNLSVKWTPEGLIISNQAEPNNKLRLSNSGIAQTDDAGETWKMVVTNGRGIVANSIVTGTLDANKISIKSGDAATFIWDAKGLRAYETTWDPETHQLLSVNLNNYIEFNDKGLIAYKGMETPFKLTPDGQLELTGKITATSGKIGSWYIEDGILTDNTDLTKAKIWLAPKGILETMEEGDLGKKCLVKVDGTGGLFRIYDDGTIYSSNAKIFGHIEAETGKIAEWELKDGTLTSAKTEGNEGIILDANNSTIYSKLYEKSNYSDGWCLTNSEAVFNNITARGAIKCAVFEYAEVQAIGGIMIIRPSTTIKDYELTDIEGEKKSLRVWVETVEGFNEGDWCRFTSSVDLAERSEDEVNKGIASGINTHLYQLQEINTQNGPWLRFEIDEIDEDFDINSLRGMGIIDLGLPSHLGADNSVIRGNIGLGLNGSTNDAIIPPSSFSVFSLEPTAEGEERYCLMPHVVLGLLPEAKVLKIDPTSTIGQKYNEKYANTYGLYADNVYLKGHIEATSGKIGNMTIDNFPDLSEVIKDMEFSVIITSSSGSTFVDAPEAEETTLTCEVYKNRVQINKDNVSGTYNFEYQWYKGEEKLDGATLKNYKITDVDLGVSTYRCQVSLSQVEKEVNNE